MAGSGSTGGFDRRLRRGCLLPGMLMALGLAACGGGGNDPPAPRCDLMSGVWTVAADYGNGLIAHQQWTIVQSACDLTLAASPPDTYGPLPNGATGYASGDGLFASWTTDAGACQYVSRLEATVIGRQLSGLIYWGRHAYGQSYCTGMVGSIPVQGSL